MELVTLAVDGNELESLSELPFSGLGRMVSRIAVVACVGTLPTRHLMDHFARWDGGEGGASTCKECPTHTTHNARGSHQPWVTLTAAPSGGWVVLGGRAIADAHHPSSLPLFQVTLTASGNNLVALDSAVGLLVKLETCVLSENPLKELPGEFATCKKLKVGLT